jgi:drug/metabolite transporter (DMT)-like permease
MQHPQPRAIAAMVLAAGSFVLNDSLMQLATAGLPPFEVVAIRGVFATLWCLPLVFLTGQGAGLGYLFHPRVFLRSLGEVVAISSFIMALVHVGVANATAIFQIAPLLTLVGSNLLWGEKVGLARLALVGVGVAGALLVAQPGAASASPYAFFAFLTALGAAARDLASRRVPRQVPAFIVTLSTLTVVPLFAAPLMLVFETPLTPSPTHLALLAAAGLCLMFGHLLIFIAFRLAPARVLAPFYYSFTVWAVFYGVLIFGTWPNRLASLGIALILGAGLAVLALGRREVALDQPEAAR